MTAHRRKKTPIAEWITAAVGAMLIALTLGSLIYETVAQQQSAPDLEVEVSAIAPARDGFRVEVRVSNRGTRTASAVHIRGEVKGSGALGEESDAVVDYVAGMSTAFCTLYFSSDPRGANLSVRAVGYQQP
jgi:uncharacterized protein (TIGR02588 family)